MDSEGEIIADTQILVGNGDKKRKAFPRITYNTFRNQFMVVYQEKELAPLSDWQIVYLILDANSKPIRPPIPVILEGSQTRPQVIYHPMDQYCKQLSDFLEFFFE